MIARAPGKLVVSGAYVVLDGAPAIVAAVDRYAIADTSRAPDFVSAELRAAFGSEPPPHVDVSALRGDGRKLGLGSSAAALVAAIAAKRFERGETNLAPIAEAAYAAHRAAQGGGSGIDVVASTFGGVLVCRTREAGPPSHEPASLPRALVVEAWSCPTSASTAELLHAVRSLRTADRGRYEALTAPAHEGASFAVAALAADDAAALIDALRSQAAAISALDREAGAGIVPQYVRELATEAEHEGAAFFGSGAGGGDVALHVASHPSTVAFRERAARLGLVRLDVSFGARGVHAAQSLLSTSPDRPPT